ncbi:MAG: hypothetical protein KBA31_11425 [Alphaproteobacteria bacterium]|nr:hypothetical protein [Alphaproteobacteria bacterium]
MKRAVSLLVLAAVAQASAAEAPPLAGSATFANGQGHISFESGLVDIGVNRVRFDDILMVDGSAIGQGGVDRIDGSVFGGTLTFVLPGEDRTTWLGRRLRLKGHFERQKGDSTQAFEGVATATSDLLGISVTSDGRALVRVHGTPSDSSLTARVFGVNSDETDSCAGSISATTYDAVVTGVSAFASCQTFAPASVSFFGVSEDGPTTYVIFAGGGVLSGPADLAFSFSETRSVAVRRGEVALEGDYDIAPNFTLSPSVGLTFGETASSFFQLEQLEGGLIRALEGWTTSQDAGIRVGARATYQVGSGFDLFASASGAVVRRKSEMRSLSFGGAALIFAEDVNGDPFVHLVEPEARAAFLGDLNVGGAYVFDTQAVGPLRLALSGGVSYDSDVATYGNVGITPTTDITAGPVAPAHLAYSGETTLSLKAEITVELP